MADIFDIPGAPNFHAFRLAQLSQRRHFNALLSHPDCRDPDHPGCVQCVEVDPLGELDEDGATKVAHG